VRPCDSESDDTHDNHKTRRLPDEPKHRRHVCGPPELWQADVFSRASPALSIGHALLVRMAR
jgi:hypothetical protein